MSEDKHVPKPIYPSTSEPVVKLSEMQQAGARLIALYNDHKIQRRVRRATEKRAKDAARQKAIRAATSAAEKLKRATVESAIASDKDRRLILLQAAVERPFGNKRVEQLAGREEEIATFWQARELAVHLFGSSPSDAKIAKIFRNLTGSVDFNRHKARGRHLIVLHLEKKGQPWEIAP